MKKKLVHCIAILLLIGGNLAAQDTWTQKANFGGGYRYYAAGFSIGNMGYMGTGIISGIHQKDFWEFNPATNVWTQKADFGGAARFSANGFSIGNKGYIGMGIGYSDFWEYDPIQNLWKYSTNFPGGTRNYSIAFNIGTNAYVGMGIGYTDFWEYNPGTNSWMQKAPFAGGPRSYNTGFSIGNKGYIGLGSGYKDFWEFDPANNQWTRKADFGGNARYGATGFSIGNKGFMGKGRANNIGDFNDFFSYNPLNDTWSSIASYPGSTTYFATGFSIGNKGYIGAAGTPDFWEYSPTPQCEGWTQQPDLPQGDGRYGSVAVGIGNFGYMGLGAGNSGYLNDFWKFDPLTKTWTQVADFPGAARQAGVAFGIADKAYVGTGITSPYIVFNDLYEYTPSSNTWVKKADYPGGGRYTAMAFSIGDKGYVGAGKDNGFTYGTNDFYEYNPTTDSWTKKADIGTVRRSGGVSFSVGNKGYMGMGFQDYDTRKKDLWEYNPATDTWVQKADLPASERYAPGAFTLGDKGFVCGGYNYSAFNDLWVYTPATDSWEQKISIPYDGSAQGIGMNIGNKGYIGFGYGYNIIYNTLWEYSPGLTINCPPTQTLCFTSSNTYTIPPLIVTSTCEPQSISYTITGATNRSGTGTDASGTFAPGTSVITWTVVDNNGDNTTCSTTVIVDNPLTVSIANVFAVNPGGNVNTIYIGYGPTALTLTATGSGGYLAPGHQYTYAWSTGATTPYISVSPSAPGTYNYTVTITDEYGCTASISKTITVVDVRCGNKLDKVIVCQVPPGNPANSHEICISKNAVAAHLQNGSYLGSCRSNSISGGNTSMTPAKEISNLDEKSIRVNPNPNNGYFTLQLNNLVVVEIKVLDQTGKVVYRTLVNNTLKAQTITMNLGSMAKGVYTIQAIGKEGITTTKMMIQ